MVRTADCPTESLNLATEFAAAGRTWVELDDDGNVVTRNGPTEDVTAGDGPSA